METFDYVVVGAGAAGCVLTNRLTEDEASSVCVLEAGGKDRHPFISIPAGFVKTLYGDRLRRRGQPVVLQGQHLHAVRRRQAER